MNWNFDISQAPKGREEYVTTGKKHDDGRPILKKVHIAPRIIAAGNGDVVTVTRWLPDAGRWEAFTKDTPPIAWQPWPEHPFAGDAK